jgi:hypothetical protein
MGTPISEISAMPLPSFGQRPKEPWEPFHVYSDLENDVVV